MGKMGMILLIPILLMTIVGPTLSGQNYDSLNLSNTNLSPSFEHWFGTDDLGRDIFTRIWQGGRISLSVGLLAAAIDLFIGLFWGGISGMMGGNFVVETTA